LNFPSGDSVQQPGWDGFCEIDEATEFIPAGRSVWEFGAQRTGITGKATEDYAKRLAEIPASERKSMTFVFVTPRRWRDREKAKWVRARRAERAWRDVVAQDADRLVHWLELFPAVGLWLATLIGKRPLGARQLQEVWDEWALATKPPMTPELLLVGRQDAEVSVWQWLNGPPSVLAVRGESVDEPLAFGYAAIQVPPPERISWLLSRSLFTAEPETARKLGDSLMPLFLFLNEPEPGLATSLVTRGHHVYAAYGPGTADGEVVPVSLARPPRYDLQRQLEAMQIDHERAVQYAQDAAQSLTVLRRLMPSAPGLPSPNWATAEHAPALVTALLTGAWDEGFDRDRAIVERLGNDSYPNIIARLTQWLGSLDSPLRKAGPVWKIASPRDAWFRLAPCYVTSEHLKRFADVAVEVLGSSDPRFDLPSSERWLAFVKGVRPAHSEFLRAGVTETLGLLGIFGKQARGMSDAEHIAATIVRSLLVNADERLWWSLSSRLEGLAEACPDAFLEGLQDSLDRNKPPVMALFDEDEDGPTGRSYQTNLLWALEILARSPRYLGRVARLLARLADADPSPHSRHANRPARSLGQIFNLHFPQTNASLAQRLRTLDVLRTEEPKASWRLMLGLIPQDHVIGDFGPLPRWRDFSDVDVEEVTWALIWSGVETIAGWLFEAAGKEPNCWKQLIEIFPQFPPARRAELVARLTDIAPQITRDERRTVIWNILRHLISHHRKFAKSNWALPESELVEIERTYNGFEPHDSLTRVAWMFERFEVELLAPTVYEGPAHSGGLDTDRLKSDDLRRSAIEELHTRFGQDALFGLARMEGVSPGLIGVAAANGRIDDATKEEIAVRSLKSRHARETDVAAGLISALTEKKAASWSESLLCRAAVEKWTPEEIVRLLVILPNERGLWERISDFGRDVEALYWERMQAWLAPKSAGVEFEYLATRLIAAGRADDALRVLVHGKGAVPSCLLAEALEAAASQPGLKERVERNTTMFQFYVEELLQHLDQTGDIPEERIALIEWQYLPILMHSRRTTLALHRAMAKLPELFVMVISALYKPDPESGVAEEPAKDKANTEAMATRAYDLLRSWRLIPGSNGTNVDPAILEGWVEDARRRCRAIGRAKIGDHCIGAMLAHAPVAEDGIWPAVPIREVIKITRNPDLDRGVVEGLCNKRGPTWRNPSTGGQLERELVAQYRSWAQSVELEWPRTSAILEEVARFYESYGRSIDDDNERRNW
jgi:hypothetical protein